MDNAVVVFRDGTLRAIMRGFILQKAATSFTNSATRAYGLSLYVCDWILALARIAVVIVMPFITASKSGLVGGRCDFL